MSTWTDEVEQRIRISEGCEPSMYHDSMGIPTVGIGFNLQRPDATHALASVGCANPGAVIDGTASLSDAQIDALFSYSLAPIESEARASLADGIFDSMTDARRFVIVDLVFNMGADGWNSFGNTRQLLNEAQAAKNAGNVEQAHSLFMEAGAHLEASAWYGQVGNRAKRDVAMIETGEWVDPDGDGSS